MSILVTYPAQITSYSLFISENQVQIQLIGIEKSDKKSKPMGRNIAHVHFKPVKGDENPDYEAIINRGGFLRITRPMFMLSSILVALEQGGKLYLNEKGNLSREAQVGVQLT